MSRLSGTIIAIGACLTLICSCGRRGAEEKGAAERILPPIGFFEEDFECDSLVVRSGETFSTLMARIGVESGKAYKLSRICEGVFDVRKMRAGNNVRVYYSTDSARVARYAVYDNNRISSTVFQCGDSLAVWNYTKPVEHQRRYTDVTIRTSLWNDMITAGTSPALIMDLADIYQWSVNFFTLQQGDRFRVIYSQSVCDGEVVSIDTVHFSIFNGAREIPAVRYVKPGESRAEYWGYKGESLKRLFLKAPLRYNRISSKFSYHRKHPVTGKVKAHTAVDYAAPTGTPVHSIGDGTVTLCGWDGTGGGNRIRIKHMQGYESCYMHLSKFAPGIKSGSRVSQGQLIGYVGATGTATGPHLDFRIWQNGKPIDPLSLNSPASDPLPKQYLEDFEKEYDRLKAEMDSLSRK